VKTVDETHIRIMNKRMEQFGGTSGLYGLLDNKDAAVFRRDTPRT